MRAKANVDSTRLRGYKVVIYPTEEQKEAINRIFDLYRAVYNLAKEIQDQSYIDGNGYISLYDMQQRLADLRSNNEEYNWLQDITIECMRKAAFDLDIAYSKFFKGICGYPNYKSKKKAKKAFGTRHDRCYIRSNYITISGLPKGLRHVDAKSHNIPEDKQMYNPRVSFDGIRYWFSCQIETPMVDMSNVPQTDIIGVDVGLKPMMVTSDGSRYEFPDNSKLEKREKRQNRRLHKHYAHYREIANRTRTKYDDVPKSKNYEKYLIKYRKTHKKMHNRNFNAIHNATKEIVSKNPKAIVIETISVEEHKQDKWFAKHQPQFSFYEMHRQLTYKAEDRGIPVIKAEHEFPSTKTCSRCGRIRDKKVHGKVFRCPSCGLVIDRDLNASINLREYGRSKINSTIMVA